MRGGNVTRRRFIAGLGHALALGVVPSVVHAQATSPPARPRRIFMVTWRGRTDVERGFTDYWREHGEPVEWIWRDAAQDRNALAAIADEISEARPDLVHTWGTPPTLGLAGPFAKPHPVIGREIPLVFSVVADPIGVKLVSTLANPQRLITGVTHVAPLSAQWEAMRTYRAFKRIGIVYNRAEPNANAVVAEWQALAAREGLQVFATPFNLNASQQPTIDGIDTILAALKGRGVDWLYLGPDSFLFTQIDTVAGLATALGIPTFAATESHLHSRAPVMVGLVSKFLHVGQFSAYKAMAMLGSERANRQEKVVPIEALRRFSFIVRMDTVRKLGIYPPLRLLDYAEFRD